MCARVEGTAAECHIGKALETLPSLSLTGSSAFVLSPPTCLEIPPSCLVAIVTICLVFRYCCGTFSLWVSFKNHVLQGLPWWPSSKETARQCRRHGFSL